MAHSLAHVGVIFGGPSPEHDVSILTGLQAARALRASRRYTSVRTLYWAKTGDFFLVEEAEEAKDFVNGPPTRSEPLALRIGQEGGFFVRRGRIGGRLEQIELDSLVVCTHGGPGEDGSLQGALDLAGVSYTGPSLASAALGMDKFATGEVLRGAGLPTLDRLVLRDEQEVAGFPGPYIVKPRFGGSSIGIDVVADFETALARLSTNVHLRRGAVLEPFRSDLFDLQLGVLSYPELELSSVERPLRQSGAHEILNYRDKYVGGAGMDAAARELPAKITPKLEVELREAARRAAAALGVRGVARIDFLSDGEVFVINEINTIPGSLSRHLFIDPPIGFENLLDRILIESKERPAARFSTAGADGTVLRDAKSISSKLG